MTAVLLHSSLAAALVLVVPLAFRLRVAARLRPPGTRWTPALGALAAASFLVDRGPLAAMLAAPWLLVPLGVLVRRVPTLRGDRLVGDLPVLVPPAYLLVGAGWLLLSRAGVRPLGFDDAIVELTAIHFHYAGFVAPLLLLRLTEWFVADDAPWAGPARLALAGVLGATPLVAAGITFSPAVGAAGAVLFAVSLIAAAALTLGAVVRRMRRGPALLLAISSLSVVVSMVLAVVYALGQWLGTPSLSLPAMARTHGVLNAAGFALGGVLGWLLHDAEEGPRRAPLRGSR